MVGNASKVEIFSNQQIDSTDKKHTI